MNQSSNRIGIAAGLVVAVIAAVWLFQNTGAAEIVRGADVAVSCGPSQRAVVRQTVTTGQPHVDIQCVPGASGQAASYLVDESGRLVEAPVGAAVAPHAPGFVPAVYQPQVAAAPVTYVERASAPAPRRAPSTRATSGARKSSSWQKRALVIGGSAGAGAGVGALIGGKKGALIGAAVGGGGAAVVDALKSR